jgi:DHA2 family multidrug resistance protein
VLLEINEPRNYGRAMALWAGSAQIGSIGGPAIGGWLTEHLDWRWVFYINIPIGILAFLGLFTFVDRPITGPRPRFDIMGFAMLSLGIAALQLLLDRGQQLDWFASTEIRVQAIVAAVCLYVFVIHMFTAERPFLNPRLFQDANFLASTAFIFLIGVVLFSTLALLPPLLQTELDYPVVLTGLMIAPRGVGTVVGMVVVDRLMARIDVRLILAAGLALVAASLWQMGRFSPDMGASPVIASGLLQGFGIALVFVPASSTAFSTLHPSLRNEGAAFFSLCRNIGSSAGISVVLFLLARNTQTVHASLVSLAQLPGTGATGAALAATGSAQGPSSLEGWNEFITRQSAFIAYLDDFRLMMVLTLCMLPFVLLVRGRRGAASGPAMLE